MFLNSKVRKDRLIVNFAMPANKIKLYQDPGKSNKEQTVQECDATGAGSKSLPPG